MSASYFDGKGSKEGTPLFLRFYFSLLTHFLLFLAVLEIVSEASAALSHARMATALAQDAVSLAENRLTNLGHVLRRIAGTGGDDLLQQTFGDAFPAVLPLIRAAKGIPLEAPFIPIPVLQSQMLKISPDTYTLLFDKLAELGESSDAASASDNGGFEDQDDNSAEAGAEGEDADAVADGGEAGEEEVEEEQEEVPVEPTPPPAPKTSPKSARKKPSKR